MIPEDARRPRARRRGWLAERALATARTGGSSRRGHRAAAALGALALALVLAHACGSGGGLSGRYDEESGVGSLEFREDGTVYVSFLGVTVAGEYELDGARVIVRGPNGSQVLTRNGARLEGGLGMTYVLAEAPR